MRFYKKKKKKKQWSVSGHPVILFKRGYIYSILYKQVFLKKKKVKLQFGQGVLRKACCHRCFSEPSVIIPPKAHKPDEGIITEKKCK